MAQFLGLSDKESVGSDVAVIVSWDNDLDAFLVGVACCSLFHWRVVVSFHGMVAISFHWTVAEAFGRGGHIILAYSWSSHPGPERKF